LNSCQIDSC